VLDGGEACDGKRFLSLEASIEEQDGSAIARGGHERDSDIVAYFHTGGTTGLPKLAQHTQAMRVAQTVSTGMMLGYDEHDCVALGLPMFHVAGSIICGLVPLFRGSRLLLLSPSGYRDREAMSQFWKVIERQGVTKLMAVPTVLSALLNVPVADADLSSLRSVVTGGAAVPTELIKAMSALVGIEVGQGFGMTEISGMGLLQPEPEAAERGCAGIRGPYVEVKIARQNADGSMGDDAATDEIGILCFRGPCVMPGYAGGRARAETFTDDAWLITGDLARMDAQHRVWITGRSKDQIIRAGHNIDAIVIEDALQAHPAVEVAAAVGKPDEYAGELPIAYVLLKHGHQASADELTEFARQRIVERAAAPTEVILVDDIPKTGIDKVFKPALRFDAIRRTFEQKIAADPEIEVAAKVTVDNDPSVGVLATVLLCGDQSERQRELVRSSLKQFTTRVDVRWDNERSLGPS
jgi:fatty-acyl-CoA synthase